MPRLSPPLTSLRFFEAAARHGSFSRAGDSLAVTHAAVSRQIRTLEETLGTPLFERRHRHVTLTPAGEAFYGVVQQALNRIDDTAHRIAGRTSQAPLILAIDSVLTQKWLLPAFTSFRRSHPEIELHIEAVPNLTGIPDGADCAFCYINKEWSNNVHIPAYLNWQFPVVSPAYLARHPELRHPQGLAGKRLVHDRTREFWRLMLAHLSLDIDWEEGTIYGDTNVLAEAVAAGEGVGTADETTSRPYLESGRLVLPFLACVPSRFVYFFSYRPALADDPRVLTLRDWVLARAGEQRDWFTAFWAEQRRTNPGWVAGSAMAADDTHM